MANVLKPRALLIDSGALNHMVACKYSFTSLESDSCISIHMGDDSQVSSQRKGTIHLEHGSFKNVLYVISLDSNLFSVYQTTQIRSTKIFVFIVNEVETSEIASIKIIVVGKENHAVKT